MCKHVAATLYGVGARLDTEPELFFRLRRVDQLDLLTAASSGMTLAAQGGMRKRIAETALAEVFGIELDEPSTVSGAPPRPASRKRRKAAPADNRMSSGRAAVRDLEASSAVPPRQATPGARADRPVRSPAAPRSRRRATRG
jgi:uncharacterized Zn finger protein